MNDEELRIKLNRLRTPAVNPAALERALERAASTLREEDSAEEIAGAPASNRRPDRRALRDRPTNSNAWTWRDWLWPSPLAWGALAVVWTACLAMSLHSMPPVGANAWPVSMNPASPVFQRPPLRLAQSDARNQFQELKRLTQIQ